ncbi:MAG: hypothetical protein AAF703_01530 [Cyanobacteria bacterium P01_D01_bin.105]
MGLFDQVMKAVADPSRQASVGQLTQILGSAKQVAQQNNTDADNMQTAMSVIGGFVRSSLNEKRQSEGNTAAEDLIEQCSANGAAAIPKLFNNAQVAEMVSAVTNKTNLNSNQVQGMLPMLLPMVMQFLNAGNTKSGMANTGNNPVLTAFLDGDGDGDVDISDMMGMASKFM